MPNNFYFHIHYKVGSVVKNSSINFGTKMIRPIIAAVMAQINTAPAEISLMEPMLRLYRCSIILHVRSIAVLKVSAAKTIPIAKITKIHSVADKANPHPKATTIIAINKSIFMFVSRERTFQMPLNAHIKLLILLFIISKDCVCNTKVGFF